MTPRLLTIDKFRILELFVKHNGVEKALNELLGYQHLPAQPAEPNDAHLDRWSERHTGRERMVHAPACGRNTSAAVMNI